MKLTLSVFRVLNHRIFSVAVLFTCFIYFTFSPRHLSFRPHVGGLISFAIAFA